jgi:biotin carboxyl carrier protein
MKREIAVDGKPWQVDISECSVGSPFKVKVNDKSREVLLEQDPDSKSFTLKVDKESYLIELPALNRNAPFTVKVNNVPFKVEIKRAAPRTLITTPSFVLDQAPRSAKAALEGAVVAPMAGTIISVRVKKGDAVKMGAVLCVLEAMKMENEITAAKNGIVKEVMVQEGRAVNEGDVLVVLK